MERLAYSVEEAAYQINLSTKTIRRMIYSGSIPYVRHGKRILILSNDIKEFLEDRRTISKAV